MLTGGGMQPVVRWRRSNRSIYSRVQGQRRLEEHETTTILRQRLRERRCPHRWAAVARRLSLSLWGLGGPRKSERRPTTRVDSGKARRRLPEGGVAGGKRRRRSPRLSLGDRGQPQIDQAMPATSTGGRGARRSPAAGGRQGWPTKGSYCSRPQGLPSSARATPGWLQFAPTASAAHRNGGGAGGRRRRWISAKGCSI